MVGGYFLAPRDGVTGSQARLGAPPSVTGRALSVEAEGDAPVDAEGVRAELRRWHVDTVLVGDGDAAQQRVRGTVERVLGPGPWRMAFVAISLATRTKSSRRSPDRPCPAATLPASRRTGAGSSPKLSDREPVGGGGSGWSNSARNAVGSRKPVLVGPPLSSG